MRVMNPQRVLSATGFGLFFVVWFAFVCAVIFVAVHFIAKFW